MLQNRVCKNWVGMLSRQYNYCLSSNIQQSKYKLLIHYRMN
jgi:hypothetical protein